MPTIYDRTRLIEMGLIIESEDIPQDNIDDNQPDEDDVNSIPDESEDSFPEANYDLQNEIIRFFNNNPGADPELFRQYASSIGVEPDELQKQMNILFSQLLAIYLNDAQQLGYGTSLTDDDVSDEVRQMVMGRDDVDDDGGEG